MKKEQCPICYTELEVVECAPCYDCGHFEVELKHFKEKRHQYNIYEVYKGLKLQLCDFCDVDFGSYKSEYLGFKDNRRIGYENLAFVAEVESPALEKDKFCPTCNQRLKFLNFIINLRELIQAEDAK
jgi:hypothetical protein